MGIASVHKHTAICDLCGHKRPAILNHTRYEAAAVLQREGYRRLSAEGTRYLGVARNRTPLVCPACVSLDKYGSHDPDCYGCRGTGKLRGFGYTPGKTTCPCMECHLCDEPTAVRYGDEGRPVCAECAPCE